MPRPSRVVDAPEPSRPRVGQQITDFRVKGTASKAAGLIASGCPVREGCDLDPSANGTSASTLMVRWCVRHKIESEDVSVSEKRYPWTGGPTICRDRNSVGFHVTR